MQGSKQSATDSKETYVYPSVLPQNAVPRWPVSKLRTAAFSNAWLRLPGGIRLLPLILPLLFILLFAGCAELPRAVPSILECNVPPEFLAPTPQPPLNDETLDHLLQENEAVRNALTLANGDKARVKQYIQERCTTLPPV